MIQVSIELIQNIKFFDKFYANLMALLQAQDGKKQYTHIQHHINDITLQDPLFITMASIQGHAIKKAHTEQESIIACASVSILCKTVSAILSRNLTDHVILQARQEGEFSFSIDNGNAFLNTISIKNMHHYIEVFGVMKNFVIGLQLIAQNYPSALQLEVTTNNNF